MFEFFRKIGRAIKNAWPWLKWVALFIVALVGFLVFKRSYKQLDILFHKSNILEKKKEIARLENQRKVLLAEFDKNEDEIKYIDARISDINDDMKTIDAMIKEMSPEEKLEEFKRLGY